MPEAPGGTSPHNRSTEHQKSGDAMRPKDTLDSGNDAAHRAKDFNPAEDVGKADPSGNPADRTD
ncbi:hypothetical protein Q9Q95_01440 [Sphingomonas sp. DG1-23]|uniref:hypothetical protein n=1 Tax=Sphingomonas sp. DG1-23 TaxID=3068316 RepID=UPI00274028E8|nr:hypothetical protein [Sphingomonas sp. DG1-23]MDP5277571.1 hypothetical protein [Sphingomonas sp. DG1-23]